MKQAIITYSVAGEKLAQKLNEAGHEADVFGRSKKADMSDLFSNYQQLIFIGSLGICVRSIASHLVDKKTDPAVINIDTKGNFVQSVVSGHVGGANELCKDLARSLGAQPVISTVSDTEQLWSLDLLPKQYDWTLEPNEKLTKLMARFVNGEKTALLLETRDNGTLFLEANLPDHVEVFFSAEDFSVEDYSLVLAVTPFVYELGSDVLYFRPRVFSLGVGSQKDIKFDALLPEIENVFQNQKLSLKSVASVSTVDIKKDEKALNQLASHFGLELKSFEGKVLDTYNVPNPSDKPKEVAGTAGVAEAAAMHISQNLLLIEKTKLKADDKYATLALAINRVSERKGFVEIVGAGPGDPRLVTVRGKMLLEAADLILYAGSLVPRELTHYAKPGCEVHNSASLDLQEQVDLMRKFYDRGLLVVRLHTGDPCIYGAIQEQMNIMDKYDMDYRITPGVSSFQAAAAALKSQFTIPEEVQTIILTRGEGRTMMPDREQLQKLAKSQSTMCIYLSATIAEKVQAQLQEHYPDDTPVAICYKLTWKEEKIYRCTMATLAKTVKDNNLSMTTLIVVGKAIDNRAGESRLYHKNFKHAFRL